MAVRQGYSWQGRPLDPVDTVSSPLTKNSHLSLCSPWLHCMCDIFAGRVEGGVEMMLSVLF